MCHPPGKNNIQVSRFVRLRLSSIVTMAMAQLQSRNYSICQHATHVCECCFSSGCLTHEVCQQFPGIHSVQILIIKFLHVQELTYQAIYAAYPCTHTHRLTWLPGFLQVAIPMCPVSKYSTQACSGFTGFLTNDHNHAGCLLIIIAHHQALLQLQVLGGWAPGHQADSVSMAFMEFATEIFNSILDSSPCSNGGW